MEVKYEMGNRVKVTTKCGEEFFHDYDQEIESVEVVKETRMIGTSLPVLAKAFQAMSEYGVHLERKPEADQIIISTCGVGDHVWRHIIRQHEK